MTETNRKSPALWIAVVGGGVVLVVLMAIFWYQGEMRRGDRSIQRDGIGAIEAPPTEGETGDSFDRTGNLMRNSPGLLPETWYLGYELPGQPGLFVKIQWTNQSRCVIESGERACVDSLVGVGDRVRVQGVLSGDEVSVRRLELIERQDKEIQLFYYAPKNDQDAAGNVQCSRQGLIAVARTIDGGGTTTDQIERAVRLLLGPNLTSEERAQGIQTEFPLDGFVMKSLSFEEGVATITFADPGQRSSGGSCRAGVLWYQIEATVKQFPGVQEVKFSPEDLFQP